MTLTTQMQDHPNMVHHRIRHHILPAVEAVEADRQAANHISRSIATYFNWNIEKIKIDLFMPILENTKGGRGRSWPTLWQARHDQ
jgi:hypothetical protein